MAKAARSVCCGEWALRMDSKTPDGILFRIPFTGMPASNRPLGSTAEARRTVWAEVRLDRRLGEATAELSADEIRSFPNGRRALDEGWWKGSWARRALPRMPVR